jgi:exonuclease III
VSFNIAEQATLSAESKPFVPKNTSRLPIIATTNARSINRKADLLSQLPDDAQIDIAVVTETWLHEANTNLFEAKMSGNYTIFSHTRSGRRGGGVALLIRREYTTSSSLISTSNNTDQPADNVNVEFIIVKARPPRLPRGYPNIFICGVYIAKFNKGSSRPSLN